MFGRNRINTTQKKLYNGGFTDFACFLIVPTFFTFMLFSAKIGTDLAKSHNNHSGPRF